MPVGSQPAVGDLRVELMIAYDQTYHVNYNQQDTADLSQRRIVTLYICGCDDVHMRRHKKHSYCGVASNYQISCKHTYTNEWNVGACREHLHKAIVAKYHRHQHKCKHKWHTMQMGNTHKSQNDTNWTAPKFGQRLLALILFLASISNRARFGHTVVQGLIQSFLKRRLA